MFLTRMALNPARRGTRRLLSSPQQVHAAVLSAFPPGTAEGSGRPLWRVDTHGPRVTLYVSSPARPDLTHVIEQAGWPTGDETWRTVDMTEGWSRLTEGQRWAFRLTANPVIARATGPGARGKVSSLLTVDQQEQWLIARAEGHGFEIPLNSVGARELVVSSRRTVRFERRTDGVKRTVSINQATYTGALVVRDADALRATLTHGIGRAKAYGCGLLTLATAP